MQYEIEPTALLYEIDRTKIVDVAIGDTLIIQGYQQLEHTWTEQDMQFMENNPDAPIFLKFQKKNGGQLVGHGVTVLTED
jgi:hypothetical protein